MSISISIDKYLLCNMFNISYKKITDEYSGMTIEEIMKAEAKAGNKSAALFDQAILDDPAKLIQLFELKDPSNKFAILSNMNEDDLDNLLPTLKTQDLVQGLNYFNKDKLIKLFQELPQEELLNYTFDMFSDEHIMQMMPDEQVNKMLLSTDMDKGQEVKCLQTMNPQILALMIESATGKPADGMTNIGMDGKPNYDKSQLLNQIDSLPDDKFQEAMLSIPKQTKKAFVHKLATMNPKLYENVDKNTYLSMIYQKKDKQAMLRSADVLSEESLCKMVSHLPKQLTAVVLTQMDTEKFANVLTSKFRGVLKQLSAG